MFLTGIAVKTEAGTVTLPQRSSIPDTPSVSKKLVVIDRHPIIGDAISSKIKRIEDIEYGGQAYSAMDSIDLIEAKKPDVIVLSLSLPDAYGLDFASQLLSLHRELRIVIYTQYEEQIFAERAIEVGVMGYVMKRAPLSDLIKGIQSVLRNETYLSASMTVRLLNKITKGFSESVSHALDKLTHRELSVLLMLSEGSNPNEIADRLKLDRKTVETHRRRVKEKLEFSGISELIRFATQWRQTQGRLLPETFLQENAAEHVLNLTS